jgi:hypothetical protein
MVTITTASLNFAKLLYVDAQELAILMLIQFLTCIFVPVPIQDRGLGLWCLTKLSTIFQL